MKKLFSAAASLVMAATMVGAVSPVSTSAADDKKGLSFLAYKDATLPEGVTNNGDTLLVSADAIAAGDVVIPVGMYLTENTPDLTGYSADATVRSDSKDIGKVKFQKFTPGADKFFDSPKEFTAADGSTFSTDKVVAFAGTSGRTGYKAHGSYQVTAAESQHAAGTDYAYLGIAWTNGASKYTWHGEKSDTYPLIVFNVTLPKGIAEGDYIIDFCNYDNEYENKSCLLEAGGKYNTDNGKLDLSSLTIKVGDSASGGSSTTTQTQTTATTATTGTITTITTSSGDTPVTPTPGGPDVPAGQDDPKKSHMVADSDIVFDFRNKDSEDGYWRLGEEGDVWFQPTLNTNGKLITAIEIYFGVEGDFTADIDTVAPALQSVSVQPNNPEMALTLTCAVGEGSIGIPCTADSEVFNIFFTPGKDLKDGLYKISIDPFQKSCTVLDGDRKRTDFTVIPGYIAIGDVSKPVDSSTTTTAASTTTQAPTSSVTTAAPTTAAPTTSAAPTSSATTAAPTTTQAPTGEPGTPVYGDTDCNGVVKINDVVLLNKWLNDNKSYDITEQGKLNADCFKPQGGKELTAEDSDAIIKSIVHLVTLPVEK